MVSAGDSRAGRSPAAERTFDPPADRAFARYVLPEVDVLLRVAQSLTRNSADAEDLVQDTLLRAYRAIERFDGRYPRAWLLTILRNAHVNRHRRRRPMPVEDPDQSQRERDRDTAQRSAEDVLMDGEFDGAVEHAFEALPAKLRLVVELVDLDGLAYQEAADVLGIPIGTVMSRLHRARRRMRDEVVEAGFAPRST